MKKLKLPNSYGGVVKMGNSTKRRRPYIVRITTGYELSEETGKVKQKYGIIGYAATRTEGLQMLAKYHECPYDLAGNQMTFRELYERWSDGKFETISNSSITSYRSAYNSCTIIYEKNMRDLKTKDLQKVIDTCGKNYPSLRNIKVLFNQLYQYALKHDLCNRDYSKFVDIAKYSNKNPNKLERKVFTKDNINTFWSLSNDKYYQIVLILIYTGLRINELLELKKEDVHLNEQWLEIKKSKTDSGLRKVPIPDKILPFITGWYNHSPNDYLLSSPDGKKFTYRNYYDSYFIPIMTNLGLTQTPHCCRHTFISLLAEAGVNPTYSKLIVGHKGAMSLTEKVYTHIDMSILIQAVNSIYNPTERNV